MPQIILQDIRKVIHIPKLERVLDRSIKAFLPGLLSIDRLAREMSAVTRVIVILGKKITGLSDFIQVLFPNQS